MRRKAESILPLALAVLVLAFVSCGPSSVTGSHSNMTLPWNVGETWYVCVGYDTTINDPFHRGDQKFSLDLVASSDDLGLSNGCKDGGSASTGKTVRAPTGGKIAWIGSTQTDILCLNTEDAFSLKIGHIKVADGLKSGSQIARDQVIGNVNGPNVMNNNVAHIHIGLFNDSVCGKGGGGTGVTIPFDSRFEGVSLPDKGGRDQHWGRSVTRRGASPAASRETASPDRKIGQVDTSTPWSIQILEHRLSGKGGNLRLHIKYKNIFDEDLGVLLNIAWLESRGLMPQDIIGTQHDIRERVSPGREEDLVYRPASSLWQLDIPRYYVIVVGTPTLLTGFPPPVWGQLVRPER